ncbi:hypothetical protein [Streptomyces phytophilus]|uniref:hypothetical protein n=1 Tax=Streptomyces phytophilus TaxID=722715 RepID=UPI0015F0AC5A|nr:hypothetical protein [Streptomyces phytophilus]
MARGHGRILASIWEDQDFTALDPTEQRLYLFLLSQANLNHAGLLPLTLRRWARKARGLTVAALETTLDALQQARFIVTDDSTEELLIRTFVRNDGVWRQPNVMAAMVSAAQEIESPRLRAALLVELDRIPLEQLSDEATRKGPSVRQQTLEHLAALRRAFGDPDPTPPATPPRRDNHTPPEGFEKGSPNPSGTPPEGIPEPPTRAHTYARDTRAHSPTPPPSPTPTPTPHAQAHAQHDPPATHDQPLPDRMTAAFLDRYKTGNTYSRKQIHRVLTDALANNTNPDELWAALERLGDTSKPVTPGTLQFALADIRKHTGADVIPLRGSQTLTGTDARVAAWLALDTGEPS